MNGLTAAQRKRPIPNHLSTYQSRRAGASPRALKAVRTKRQKLGRNQTRLTEARKRRQKPSPSNHSLTIVVVIETVIIAVVASSTSGSKDACRNQGWNKIQNLTKIRKIRILLDFFKAWIFFKFVFCATYVYLRKPT